MTDSYCPEEARARLYAIAAEAAADYALVNLVDPEAGVGTLSDEGLAPAPVSDTGNQRHRPRLIGRAGSRWPRAPRRVVLLLVRWGGRFDPSDEPGQPSQLQLRDEEETEAVFARGPQSFEIPGVGSVRVDIADGRLELVNLPAPGRDIRIKNAKSDEIKVGFRNGSHEAEFEAELEDGKIKIEVERESG